jgi:hypothetical protein
VTRLSDTALQDLKDRHPVSAVAAEKVRLRAGSSKFGRAGFTGPCPICSADPNKISATCFECDTESWVCAKCPDGGDVIRLLMRRDGVDFIAAIDRLGGARPAELTPKMAERRGAQDYAAGVSPTIRSIYQLNSTRMYCGRPGTVVTVTRGDRRRCPRATASKSHLSRYSFVRPGLCDMYHGRATRAGCRRLSGSGI